MFLVSPRFNARNVRPRLRRRKTAIYILLPVCFSAFPGLMKRRRNIPSRRYIILTGICNVKSVFNSRFMPCRRKEIIIPAKSGILILDASAKVFQRFFPETGSESGIRPLQGRMPLYQTFLCADTSAPLHSVSEARYCALTKARVPLCPPKPRDEETESSISASTALSGT